MLTSSWRNSITAAATVAALTITVIAVFRLSERAARQPMPQGHVISVTEKRPPPAPPPPPLNALLRNLPKRFPRDTYLPKRPEGATSGSIDMTTFSAGRDLIFFDDPRIWWESDNDHGDDECDHTMHAAIEAPLQRLVTLVVSRGGILEVHDAYRASGIHNSRSLHREGRAIDVTCDELGLETLAKLCWAAGFDWVYHEVSGGGGAHVHASVRRDNHLTMADLTRRYYAANRPK